MPQGAESLSPRLTVAVRVRPLMPHEADKSWFSVVDCLGGKVWPNHPRRERESESVRERHCVCVIVCVRERMRENV
jgi:hypothetical protein